MKHTVKHTPGPWTLTDTATLDYMRGANDAAAECIENLPPYWFIDGGSGNPTSGGFHISGHFSEANAKLITAAPDLLEACKIALESLRAWNSVGVGLSSSQRASVIQAYEESPEIQALVKALEKAGTK